jgi:hypothetical protein
MLSQKYPIGFVCSEIESFDGWIVIQGYFVDCPTGLFLMDCNSGFESWMNL